jgi:hypothetical protein
MVVVIGTQKASGHNTGFSGLMTDRCGNWGATPTITASSTAIHRDHRPSTITDHRTTAPSTITSTIIKPLQTNTFVG